MKDSLFLRRKLRRSPKQQYSVITSVGPADKEEHCLNNEVTESTMQTARMIVRFISLNSVKIWNLNDKEGPHGWHTSNSAGSQKVDNIHVVSQVTEDFQLWHECLFLRGMCTCCGKKGTHSAFTKGIRANLANEELWLHITSCSWQV